MITSRSIAKYFWMFTLAAVLAMPLLAQEGQQPAQDQKPAPEPELVVPVGTIFPVVLDTYLTTKNTQVGDVFYADTDYPIWIQQRLVIPRGSIVKGTVTEVTRPGAISGKGRIAIRIDTILLPNGVERQLVADFHGIHGPGAERIDRKTETVEAGSKGNTGQDVGTVVATSGTGALIGGVASHGAESAVIGAGAGAAAGVVIALLSRDRNVMLEKGVTLDLELRQPLRFAYNEVIFSQADVERIVRKIPASTRPKQQQRSRFPVPFGLPRIIR